MPSSNEDDRADARKLAEEIKAMRDKIPPEELVDLGQAIVDALDKVADES